MTESCKTVCVVFDVRDLSIRWTCTCERERLAEQEDIWHPDSQYLVSRELRRSYEPDALYVDPKTFVVRERSTDDIAEKM